MTVRYHYFSHIESTRSGSLVLTDPLDADRDEGLVCRYELHRAQPEVLAPDPEYGGVKAYHRLLPLSRDHVLSEQSFMVWEPLPARNTASAARIRFDAKLYFEVAMALAGPGRSGFDVTGNPVEEVFLDYATDPGSNRELWLPSRFGGEYSGSGLAFFEGSAETAIRKRARHGDVDFSVWGNPFRAEGLKLIGLAAIHRSKRKNPLFLVHDPTGELLYALFLASSHYRSFFEAPPFRTVLVQTRPFDMICRAFEGAEPDWRMLDQPANHACLRPPPPFLSEIVNGIADHLGTAISLAAPESGNILDLFEEALAILFRTGFADEEDHLIYLHP